MHFSKNIRHRMEKIFENWAKGSIMNGFFIKWSAKCVHVLQKIAKHLWTSSQFTTFHDILNLRPIYFTKAMGISLFREAYEIFAKTKGFLRIFGGFSWNEKDLGQRCTRFLGMKCSLYQCIQSPRSLPVFSREALEVFGAKSTRCFSEVKLSLYWKS